jgi:hypothetical protein
MEISSEANRVVSEQPNNESDESSAEYWRQKFLELEGQYQLDIVEAALTITYLSTSCP